MTCHLCDTPESPDTSSSRGLRSLERDFCALPSRDTQWSRVLYILRADRRRRLVNGHAY